MSALEIYDVVIDAMRPLIASDIMLLRQLQWAYGQLRQAKGDAPHLAALQAEMDRIHAELLRRLKA